MLMLNNFPRPIESAMESNRLAPSADTCELCHAREKLIGPRLRILTKFKDDEKNTRTETVLMTHVGGGRQGGIHGAHMGPGVRIRYAAADKKRQTIAWVEYRNSENGATRTYLASGAKADSSGNVPQQPGTPGRAGMFPVSRWRPGRCGQEDDPPGLLPLSRSAGSGRNIPRGA
jgi:hypothetical protein